jgi:hypothetical protein
VAYTNVRWSADAGYISDTGRFTAPRIGADTTVTITATSLDDPGRSATATVKVKASPVNLYAILSGSYIPGGSLIDSAGRRWVQVTQQTSGAYSVQGQTVSLTCTQNNNTCSRYANPQAAITGIDQSQLLIYQGATYGYQYEAVKGSIKVVVDVPPGLYRVTLKFCDYGPHGAGYYGQDISINGKAVFTGFDLHEAAGGAFKGIDRTVDINAVGALTILFTPSGDRVTAISGISVESLGG